MTNEGGTQTTLEDRTQPKKKHYDLKSYRSPDNLVLDRLQDRLPGVNDEDILRRTIEGRIGVKKIG